MSRLETVKNFEEYITEQESAEIEVPKEVREYINMALEKEKFFDEEMKKMLEE